LSTQYEANRAYSALGASAAAIVEGSSLREYAARLVEPFLQHSPKWKTLGVDVLQRMDAVTFQNVKQEVYADAIATSTDKNRGQGDQLREFYTYDQVQVGVTKPAFPRKS
jgi:hypothetical protein